MLSAFLPGQEEGNIPYVVEGGYGAFSKNPAVIADTVTEWLTDDAKLSAMAANARLAARPHATEAIARDIGKMVGLIGVCGTALLLRQPHKLHSLPWQQMQGWRLSRM